MKTLIIPDIHTKHSIAEAIIQSEPADEVVLLGDYFDDWGDTPEQNAATADWLKPKLLDPRYRCLWGNHDQYYLLDDPHWLGSGYEAAKKRAIRAILKPEDIRCLLLLHVSQGYLMSHAGLDKRLCTPSIALAQQFEAITQMLAGKHPYLVNIGRSRGGYSAVGGVTWQDWSELEIDPEHPQIVGHTEFKKPRERAGSWCIDTRLHHYAVIEDGKLTIKEAQSAK